ncbi:hypothetical protein [Rhabdothermincola sediminis]|uniref:hypothetical protein n=1 Tax=Rhabdothermincola sediminis TaxID=2751370 RepID=UPI001AA03071|nr:hypothetical protein [Rhabdothermincola sediminis]
MRSELELLGLRAADEPDRWRLEVLDRLTRLDGRLYGGAAIAASVAVAEALPIPC